jgi:hypothetical protein
LARHLADAILVTEQVGYFLIENLPGELAGLAKDYSAVFRVGVVAKIGTLIDKTLAVGVDHDAERIGVFLKSIAYG